MKNEKLHTNSGITATKTWQLFLLFATTFLLVNHSVLGQQKSDAVYEAVETPAQPQGGMSGFQEYVSRHLTYPT